MSPQLMFLRERRIPATNNEAKVICAKKKNRIYFTKTSHTFEKKYDIIL